MGKLIPLVMALIGAGAGIGAGLALRPPAGGDVALQECPQRSDASPSKDGERDQNAESNGASGEEAAAKVSYVKLNNQFVVPVVKTGKVAALVVMSISLEVTEGGNEAVFAVEPKLRDAFLQVLFDHANAGGFDGAFTASNKMLILRDALRETAVRILGKTVRDVMITDIVRQDS